MLREVLGDASVLTTSASNDPRALPLYARAGMQPLWPYHFLLGDPRKVLAPSTVTVERARARRARRDRPRGHGLRSSDRPRVLRGRVSRAAAAHRLGRPGDRLRLPRTAPALGDEPLDPPDARGRARASTRATRCAPRSRMPERRALTGSSPRSAGRTQCCGRLLASGFVIPEQDIYMATSPDLVGPAPTPSPSGLRLTSVASSTWICASGSSPNTTACALGSSRASATSSPSTGGRSGPATAAARSRTSCSTRPRIRTSRCPR